MALIKTERPDELESSTTRLPTGLGTIYVTVSMLNDKPFEMLAHVSKSGKDVNAMTEALGRLVSLCFQYGIDVKEVIKQLKGIGGETPMASGKRVIKSIPDEIALFLERKYIKEEK